MAAPPHPKLNLRQLAERGDRPFPSHPQVARYFPAGAIENARRRATRAIERGDGPCLMVGGAGTGKSLLLQVLAAQFHERFDVVLLACARICTRRALLQAILFELNLPYRLRDEGQLRFSVLDHLLSAKQGTSELLLLVDEAQSLSVTLLDELRVLTNLVHAGSPRVRLVLSGAPLLEESFANPELESFSQRLAARCYLTPFSRDETTQFVRAQLDVSNVDVDATLSADACEAVFEATDGVPRLINQLCDRAISLAAVQNCRQLDRRNIQAAWSDLQQLPTPDEVSAPSPKAVTPAATGVIEFGALEREPHRDELRIHRSEAENVSTIRQVAPAPVVLPQSPARFEQHPLPPLAVKSEAANPFAEPFVEEEIVLDQFAAWGDLFHQDSPRVENQRDRDFASCIRKALDANADGAGLTSSVTADTADNPGPTLNVESLTSDDRDPRWPPLRLLEMTNAPEPQEPSQQSKLASFAELVIRLNEDCEAVENIHRGVNSPILIIDDDATDVAHMGNPSRMRPPAKRQDYRRLFSRLRSG